MDAPSIELELKQALARNDRRLAASLLVEHYASDVLAVCRAMLRDRTLAEDLAQDTFGRAIAGLATFRGESSPRTWLLSIARNGCLDFLRRRKASPIDEGDAEPDAHAAPAPAALDRLVGREDVERALAPLGETERALVVLHYGHGVGYAELAEAFSLREGAVRMRMSRAVEKMKHALAERAVAPSMAAPVPAPGAAAPRRSAGVPWPLPSAPAAPRARVGVPATPAPATPAPSPLREALPSTFRARLDALVAATT